MYLGGCEDAEEDEYKDDENSSFRKSKRRRAKGQDEEGGERQEVEQSIKVTARDRELVGHAALMRYAAERHLQRLVFGAPVLKANRKRKTGEPLAINVMRRRL